MVLKHVPLSMTMRQLKVELEMHHGGLPADEAHFYLMSSVDSGCAHSSVIAKHTDAAGHSDIHRAHFNIDAELTDDCRLGSMRSCDTFEMHILVVRKTTKCVDIVGPAGKVVSLDVAIGGTVGYLRRKLSRMFELPVSSVEVCFAGEDRWIIREDYIPLEEAVTIKHGHVTLTWWNLQLGKDPRREIEHYHNHIHV